jgi:hypothetical protein
MLVSRKSKLKAVVAVSIFLIVLLVLAVPFHHHNDHRFHSECPVCLAGTHVLWAEGLTDFGLATPVLINSVQIPQNPLCLNQECFTLPPGRAPPLNFSF